MRHTDWQEVLRRKAEQLDENTRIGKKLLSQFEEALAHNGPEAYRKFTGCLGNDGIFEHYIQRIRNDGMSFRQGVIDCLKMEVMRIL